MSRVSECRGSRSLGSLGAVSNHAFADKAVCLLLVNVNIY